MKLFKRLIDKYNGLELAIKVTLWYTICNVMQRGVSIVTVPIFTRMLTPEQYGTYSLYNSWFTILTVFTSLNLYYGVFNKAMIKYKNDIDCYISAMQGLVITLNGIYLAVYLLFREQFNSLFGLSTLLMLMMVAQMVLEPAMQFWSGKQRFAYRYKAVVLRTAIQSILNPLLGVIAVYLTDYKTEARVAGIVVADILVCGVLMILQFYRGKKFFNREYWSYSLKFNIPLIPHYLSSSLLSQGDRIVIQKTQSVMAVAFYSVAYNVGMLTQLVTNAIAQAITPWLYRCLEKKEYDGINARLNAVFLAVSVISFLLMLFAPEVIIVFAAKQYRDAVYAIPPVAASVFFIFAYNIYANFEFFFEKRLFIAIGSVTAAAVNIALNIMLVPAFGYISAGYATLICYVVYAYAHYFFSYSICKQYIGRNIFNIKFFNTMCVLEILSCIIASALYALPIIRYAIILVSLVSMYIYRNQIRMFSESLLKR